MPQRKSMTQLLHSIIAKQKSSPCQSSFSADLEPFNSLTLQERSKAEKVHDFTTITILFGSLKHPLIYNIQAPDTSTSRHARGLCRGPRVTSIDEMLLLQPSCRPLRQDEKNCVTFQASPASSLPHSPLLPSHACVWDGQASGQGPTRWNIKCFTTKKCSLQCTNAVHTMIFRTTRSNWLRPFEPRGFGGIRSCMKEHPCHICTFTSIPIFCG